MILPRPATVVTGHREYHYTCGVCGQPGIGTTPMTKTHPACVAERKRREWERYKRRHKGQR